MTTSHTTSKKSASKKPAAPASSATPSVAVATDEKSAAPVVLAPSVAPPAPAPVGPGSPLADRVARCASLLDEAIALFGDATDLTPLDRRRIKKVRKGGDKVIPILAQAAKQAQVNLPLLPLGPMETDLANAQALMPVQTKIGVLQKQVADQVYVSEGASWATAVALYSVLRRLSKKNGQLATTIEPAAEFFGYRHPSVRADHPRTKKGKEALAEKKAQEAGAAQAASVPAVSSTPAAAPAAAATSTPVTQAAPAAAPVATHD